MVKLLGKLSDFDSSVLANHQLLEIQSFLAIFDDSSLGRFDPYQTLKMLSPSCEDLISDCSWNGVQYDCNDLFNNERTMAGFCCTFNYIPLKRNQHLSNFTTKIIKLNNYRFLTSIGGGLKKGLSVKINHNTSDYFYTLFSSSGAIVDIFNPSDFPDMVSGNLQQRLVPIGVEMYVKLSATLIYAAEEVRKYPIQKRKCVFPEESKTLFGDYSTHSDCLLNCRLKSMIALCECIPLMFANTFTGDDVPQCSFQDLPCLFKYQHKWERYYPFDYNGDDMEAEKQDSLVCLHCVPNCRGISYTVRTDSDELFGESDKPLNQSLLHVYFDVQNVVAFEHDVVYYWFDIVSNFGGMFSLTIGLSLISVVELVYFFSVKLYKACAERYLKTFPQKFS
ncbi:sodium channel protein Nach-like [Photinus pyralis]|nr:sodium channel protein Nach-like [Photinus pyralis]